MNFLIYFFYLSYKISLFPKNLSVISFLSNIKSSLNFGWHIRESHIPLLLSWLIYINTQGCIDKINLKRHYRRSRSMLSLLKCWSNHVIWNLYLNHTIFVIWNFDYGFSFKHPYCFLDSSLGCIIDHEKSRGDVSINCQSFQSPCHVWRKWILAKNFLEAASIIGWNTKLYRHFIELLFNNTFYL